ncbi:MAG: hypothetical protein WBG19_09000 [Thermoplasmata archaeon]
MTAARIRDPGLPRAHLPLGGVAAVAIVLLLALPPSAHAAPVYTPPSTGYTPGAWNNSVVRCTFDPHVPAVAVTANSARTAGMWMGAGALTETSTLGVVTATASLGSATWAATNLSAPNVYSLAYHSLVPVTLGVASLGTADVTVTFVLLDTPGAAGPADRNVTITLSVAGWPWQPLAENLQANLTLAPASPSNEHLVNLGTAGSPTILSVANRSAAPAAYLNASPSADVTNSSGILRTIPIASSLLSLTPEGGTLAVSFGAPAADAKAINYTATMSISPAQPIGPNLPLPGHLPTTDLAAVAGAALIASLGLAAATRRARRSRSDLVYVEEEE